MENIDNLKLKITEAIEERIQDTDLFLVDIQISVTSRIGVFLDGKTEHITIKQCTDISRFLENYLESNALVGEKYLLEVSSPGLDEPFKVTEQYVKWLNKPVEVLLLSGIKEIGELKAFDENSVTIEVAEQKKKKEIIPAEQKTFANADIKYTRKHFVFK
ncbi:MAG TPA: hypothetical protein VLZ75_08295 [Chitinophagales bacterium]|nr:hypothetical protein [Chitinophagales bacterium]